MLCIDASNLFTRQWPFWFRFLMSRYTKEGGRLLFFFFIFFYLFIYIFPRKSHQKPENNLRVCVLLNLKRFDRKSFRYMVKGSKKEIKTEGNRRRTTRRRRSSLREWRVIWECLSERTIQHLYWKGKPIWN